MTATNRAQVLQTLFAAAEDGYEDVVGWRRHMHANPELSFVEYETSQFIAERLQSFGLDVKRNVGGTGLTALVKGGQPGKTIAFRADFDALPIQELNSVSYASTREGVSHACGHDGHTSALLGFAKVIAQHSELLHGNVLLVFQHAEEKPPGGAKQMIAQHILDEVDYVFAVHLDSALPVGTLAVGGGFKMAASDYFKISLKGRGAHGAQPHLSLDALVAGAELVGSLQKIVSRSVDPLQSAVVTVGQFHAGTAANVIAENAWLEGTVRTYSDSIRSSIQDKIERITQGITQAHDIQYEIDYLLGYPALHNDEEQSEIVRGLLQTYLSDKTIQPLQSRMGAEDFAYFLNEKPGTYFRVGSNNGQTETMFAHHHGCFNFDERALQVIQQAFLTIAVNYLSE